MIYIKKSKYPESQIASNLKEVEGGVALKELSRQHGFSRTSFYKWKVKSIGMSVSDLKRMKDLEEENRG